MKEKDVKRVLDNKNTQVIVEWLGGMLDFPSKIIMSDQFFHTTHTEEDKKILMLLLLNFFQEIQSIERVGSLSVVITKK